MKLDHVNIIGIVGTGMMATSLAVLTTGHGYKTIILARSDTRAAESKAEFDAFYRVLTAKGLITSEQAAICTEYVQYTKDYSALRDADVVFECVTEDASVKHAVYREIEDMCPHVKVICSVSSAIEVDTLVEGLTTYADRVIVTHPFNPPHLVPYFELASGSQTADGVVDFARELLIALDRKPVVLKKSTPGFIGNRLQFALWREALHLVESGVADPHDIDTCLMYSFCPRYTSIGIFEHFDVGGMELNYASCENIFPYLGNSASAPKIITDLIDEGKLGQRSGVGFYDWRDVDMDAYRERVSKPYWGFFDWDVPEKGM